MLSFLITFCCESWCDVLRRSLLCSHIQTNLHLKPTGSFNQVYFRCLSITPVCNIEKEVYEIDYTETSLRISPIFLTISLNTDDNFLFIFLTKSNSRKPRFSSNIQLGILRFEVVLDARKVITYDFCFTNLCICGVARRGGRFFRNDLYILMSSQFSCNQKK